MVQYRIENLRTKEAFTLDNLPAEAPNDEMEWILAFEVAPGEWRPSSYHIRDIVAVHNPKSFAEVMAHLREISEAA